MNAVRMIRRCVAHAQGEPIMVDLGSVPAHPADEAWLAVKTSQSILAEEPMGNGEVLPSE